MTCESMLERMLDAEPAELRGEGDTPLAAHLRTCTRCRAVAARIAGDTAALLAAVREDSHAARRASVGRPRIAHGRAIAAGTLAAAALLAMAVWMSAPEPGSAGRPPSAPAPAPAPGEGPVAAVAVRTPVAVAAPVLPAERFPAPPPIQPERLGAAGSTVRRGAPPPLAVHPPPGVRVAVLRTANPTITVVWLY